MPVALDRLASWIRRDGKSYRFDERLRGTDVASLLAKVSAAGLRGALHRWRFGAADGILLVGRSVRLSNLRYVTFAHNLIVEDLAEIQGLSEEGIRFGANVTIGRGAMIRPSGYYGRDMGVGLKVGDGSNIGPAAYIGCSGGISIGARVMMGPFVSIFSENHIFDEPDLPMAEQGIRRRPVTIGDDCWLASGSTILAGVEIGEGSVVAAGAVVTRNVPPFSVVGGVPARVLTRRTS